MSDPIDTDKPDDVELEVYDEDEYEQAGAEEKRQRG